ncbi:uncharacterized protein LOC105695118 isoform X2 [Orussus abietinus]|uniref:uncharacterized protein LOC105695118 isoform X2 n=1 Tax=Orussus abietinus TaxID=222816 RepID=UPI000C715B49|nr:uncharacterized protein LOC105695118 isoform X2 [Orussus abietinus]
MSSKTNGTCNLVPAGNKTNLMEQLSMLTSKSSKKEYKVEITFTTEKRKRSSEMIGGTSVGQRAVEKKKRHVSGEIQNWSKVLPEQNRSTMKKGIQQFAARTQACKLSRHSSVESKEGSKSRDNRKLQRSNEPPTKHAPSQKKSEELLKTAPNSAVPSSRSLISSSEALIVVDRGIQCGRVSDCQNDRYGVFNPVRTLEILMKELERLIGNEKTSKILADMQQALLWIPIDQGKPATANLEEIALRTELATITGRVEAKCQQMDITCKSLREQVNSLQQQVQKQKQYLEEARQREAELETVISSLRTQLGAANKATETNEKTITELRAENKRIELLQKVAQELRTELNEKTELAEQRFMETQYLKLEQEKLLMMSSYKDSQLDELRSAIKELQRHISDQLLGMRDAYKRVEESNVQISLVHGGLACSSPTPTSSERSIILGSCQGMSEVSISTIENSCQSERPRKSSFAKDKPIAEDTVDDGGKNRAKDSNVQLEFVSLPCGETSQTISSTIREDKNECQDLTGFSDEERQKEEAKDDHWRRPEEEAEKPPERHSEHEIKNNSKRNGLKSLSRLHRSFDAEKKRQLSKELPSKKISTKMLRVPPAEPIDVNIKQLQNMFKDIRQQSKFPVNIPSPLRHFPQPDWSDSSLPSISGISESNAT